MGITPAEVAFGTDVDERNLHVFRRSSCGGRCRFALQPLLQLFARRQLALYTLDEEVHVQLLIEAQALARRQHFRAVCGIQRSTEHLERPVHDLLLAGVHHARHVRRHLATVWRQVHGPIFHVAVERLALERPVQHRLRNLDVFRTPVPHRARQHRVAHELAHVRVIADAETTCIRRRLLRLRRILVLGDDVGALRQQGIRRFLLLRRVKPRVRPHHNHLGLRVRLPHALGEAVDASHHLGNRERSHVADLVRLRHLPGHQSTQVPGFFHGSKHRAQVRLRLVAGYVHELRVRKFLRHRHCRVHEPETRGQDQVVVLLRKVADHTLRLRTFRHVLDIGRLHLVTQRLLQRQTSLVVRPRPAHIADRRHIHERDFQLVLRRFRRGWLCGFNSRLGDGRGCRHGSLRTARRKDYHQHDQSCCNKPQAFHSTSPFEKKLLVAGKQQDTESCNVAQPVSQTIQR